MTNWVEGFLDIEKTDILFGSALVFCWLAWRIALCNVWMFSAIPSPRLKAFCLGLTGHCSSSCFANILLKRRTSTELTVIGQQFLAHFEWFLALFQISDVKPELSPVELKVCKNGIFGVKTYFKKIFLGYFCPPIKVMWINWAKRASKWVLIGGALKAPP